MFDLTGALTDVAHAIQLALAPVFLLTAIAGLLNVMAARLGRIIDRARFLTETRDGRQLLASGDLGDELANLERRRQLASAAITACTLAALLVCTVIVALFLEVLVQWQLKLIEGVLFTSATVALVVGLAYFLREVHLATQTVRIELRAARHEPQEHATSSR
jgi:hypothetical protein